MNTNLSGLLLLAKALALPDDQPLPNDPMDLLRMRGNSTPRSSNASPVRSTLDSSRGYSRGGATLGDDDDQGVHEEGGK